MMDDAQDEITPPQAETAALDQGPEDEVSRLNAEIASLKEQALRYLADAENTKRRAEREMNDARAYAIQRFARDLLDAADILGKAVMTAPKEAEDPTVKNFVLGIEMTEKSLQSAFERNGLKKLDPKRGDRFDPHVHQAMMEQAADDLPPGSVLMVMQPGYELFGRTIRPAMVAVTPKAAAPKEEGPAPANPYARQDDASGRAVDEEA